MDITEKSAAKALNPASGFLSAFTHTAAAYEGCGFGAGNSCPFCYVRASAIQVFAGAEWGSWVRAKVNYPDLLRTELRAASRSGSLGQLRIYMSSASDPWQPLEAKMGLTRAALAVFADHPPGALVLQTRSCLARRDLDLIAAIPSAILNLTIETNRDDVRRDFTPKTSSPAARLALAREAKQRGIWTQVTVSPLLPHDPEPFADQLAAVDRVIIDTFQRGDGSGGARSQGLGMPARLAAWGEASTWKCEAAGALERELVARMGRDRVLRGQEGFGDVAPVWGRGTPAQNQLALL